MIEMNSQFKDQIEKGTRIAFMHYIVQQTNVTACLQANCSEVIQSTIRSIENNPKVIAAKKDTQADTALEKIIEAAAEHLPKIINTLGSRYKLVHQKQEK